LAFLLKTVLKDVNARDKRGQGEGITSLVQHVA